MTHSASLSAKYAAWRAPSCRTTRLACHPGTVPATDGWLPFPQIPVVAPGFPRRATSFIVAIITAVIDPPHRARVQHRSATTVG
jgi:hypothetical protein